ncbi:MAG: ABC transporter permease [Pirellulales bacterium]|nr:ABC transporter permease [Pirellulales bacterium]
MNWTNIFLIFCREVRDQLRDRRMLFMMFILPLMLYPLMGLSVMQLTQFLKQHIPKVLLIGAPRSAEYPPLVQGEEFSKKWVKDLNTFQIRQQDWPDDVNAWPNNLKEQARHWIEEENYDVVVAFPANFAASLNEFHTWLLAVRQGTAHLDSPPRMPQPQIFSNTARQKSVLALHQVQEVLRRWQSAISQKNLSDTQVPPQALRPFEFDTVELAQPEQKSAATWSRILPMLLILWALTGAFYPAIDLCAGEKERGTLETLLCSPAEREEIVTGKMLTVMLFSVGTSLLNLLSIGLTGLFIFKQLESVVNSKELGVPPLETMGWLVLGLIPVAILFSALCVALASFARSSKEGQFYMMPLMLCVLPLAILPMDPRMELTLGNALLPISGLILLLRSLLEGEFLKVWPYFLPVTVVTGLGCWVAVRWAVDQFNREEILFRESERFDLRLWIWHLFRDRRETPNVAMGLACALLILIVQFFVNWLLASHGTGGLPTLKSLVTLVLISQLVVIATPSLLMTIMLTTRPDKTLLLHWPGYRRVTVELASAQSAPAPAADRAWWLSGLITLALAALLALVLQPATHLLAHLLQVLYPISAENQAALQVHLQPLQTGPAWLPYVLLALLPAICEELAFRGFILSGLRHWGSRRRAILLSAFFFGITHTIIQQSLSAMILGVVLGYIAVKSNSILPSFTFHALHNALGFFVATAAAQQAPWLEWMLVRGTTADQSGTFTFTPAITILALLISGVILAWFGRLPQERTEEETVWDAIQENRQLEMT